MAIMKDGQGLGYNSENNHLSDTYEAVDLNTHTHTHTVTGNMIDRRKQEKNVMRK